MSSPIADLSYRNYTGPLESPRHRWWAIARHHIRAAFQKRSLWVMAVLSGWYFGVMLIVMFITEQIVATQLANAPSSRASQSMNMLMSISWRDQFVNGLAFSQLLMMGMTILIGAGTIANDNRTNALLVYLSKPCTKKDYILGKWLGTFIPLLVASSVMPLFFYLYGVLSFQNYGFWSNDPWILPKLVVSLVVTTGFYTSLIIGVSSFSNQGRTAGAVFAFAYVVLNLFTQMMTMAILNFSGGMRNGNVDLSKVPHVLKQLYYGSVDGLNIGFMKGVFGTNVDSIFIMKRPNAGIESPGWLLPFAVMTALSALFIWSAWRRVRAVEVVG